MSASGGYLAVPPIKNQERYPPEADIRDTKHKENLYEADTSGKLKRVRLIGPDKKIGLGFCTGKERKNLTFTHYIMLLSLHLHFTWLHSYSTYHDKLI